MTAPAVNRSVPSRRQGGGSADDGACATTGSRTSRDHRPRQAPPPTTRHHLGRALRLGLATALTAGPSGAVALLAQAAGNTLVFTHNGTAQATYGVNGAVYVDGTIMFDLACSFAATPGIDDFVYPATDVYIVTAGSATAGAKLTAPRSLPLRPGGRRTFRNVSAVPSREAAPRCSASSVRAPVCSQLHLHADDPEPSDGLLQEPKARAARDGRTLSGVPTRCSAGGYHAARAGSVHAARPTPTALSVPTA